MAKQVRKPPSISDELNPRSREAFDRDLHDQHKLVGIRTFDLPSIIAGGITTFTVTANGAKANMQQTVEYGLPANWNTNLVVASGADEEFRSCRAARAIHRLARKRTL